MSEGFKKVGVFGLLIVYFCFLQLYLVVYWVLGLYDWIYECIECGVVELFVVVGGFGLEWVGVLVIMLGKFVVLWFVDECIVCVDFVGLVNILVWMLYGWWVDNIDIDGVVGVLGVVVGYVLVLGFGGIVLVVVVGLVEFGVIDIIVVVCNLDKVVWLVDLGIWVGVVIWFCVFDSGGLVDVVVVVEVLVSIILVEVVVGYVGILVVILVLLDVIYDLWFILLVVVVGLVGGWVISGLQMLLYQVFVQVEQFIGLFVFCEVMICVLVVLDQCVLVCWWWWCWFGWECCVFVMFGSVGYLIGLFCLGWG